MQARTILTARVLGLLSFAAGVGLLITVFIWATQYLDAPAPPSQANLATEAVLMAGRVGLLFVLGFVASAVAGRGIQLFQSSFPPPTDG